MERIHSKIESFLRTGEGNFDSLALELFQYQFERNIPYQSFCRSLNRLPAQVQTWQNIPAVPVRAFKSAILATFRESQSAAIFESSGTTLQTPSRHYVKDLRYYEASLKSSFEKGFQPSRVPFLILTPPPAEAPRSSLTWMMDVVRRKWGTSGSEYLVRHGRLDDQRLEFLLEQAQKKGEPLALLGTTLAFLSFFDYCQGSKKRFQLSAGTRLMDTGGMKGTQRQITRPEFVRLAGEILGIPEDACVNEYGMCEMSSQFYGRGASAELAGPPWVRTLIDAQSGVMTHFDLANIDSVMAIETEDVGRRAPDGFILLGRAPQADLKGCSLAAEAFLA